MKKNVIIAISLVMIFCGFFTILIVAIFLLGRNNKKDNINDSKTISIIKLLNNYEKASIDYTSLFLLETSSITYNDWQTRISKNLNDWEEIDQISNEIIVYNINNKYNNFVYAADNNSVDSSNISIIEDESFNNLTFTIQQDLPEDLVTNIAFDSNQISKEVQNSLKQLQSVSRDEYREAELTTEFNKSDNISFSKLLFLSVGNYIPFVQVDSQESLAAQTEILARSIVYFTGADYALSNTENGTIVFHDMMGLSDNKKLALDTSKLSNDSDLYILNSNKSSKVYSLPNFKETVGTAKNSVSIDINLLNLSVTFSIDESDKIEVQDKIQGDNEVLNYFNTNTFILNNFQDGSYNYAGSTIKVGDTVNSNEDLTPTKNNYAGTYKTSFVYIVPASQGKETITMTITINNDNSISCIFNADLPYHTYTYPYTTISASLKSNASGTFPGKLIGNNVSCSGTINSTSTSVISGYEDTTSTSGEATVSGIIDENNKIVGKVSFNSVSDFIQTDFTAEKEL